MRRLLWIPLVLIALVIPATVLAGGGAGFNGVIGSLEAHYSARATHIPLMGIISLCARAGSHGQVANLHVAEFDHFSQPLDAADVTALVQQKLGTGWERVVLETSRHGQKTEQSLIFMRDEHPRIGLFILDHDSNELDVVQLSIDPSQLGQTLHKYTHHNHDSNDSDSGNQVSD